MIFVVVNIVNNVEFILLVDVDCTFWLECIYPLFILSYLNFIMIFFSLLLLCIILYYIFLFMQSGMPSNAFFKCKNCESVEPH